MGLKIWLFVLSVLLTLAESKGKLFPFLCKISVLRSSYLKFGALISLDFGYSYNIDFLSLLKEERVALSRKVVGSRQFSFRGLRYSTLMKNAHAEAISGWLEFMIALWQKLQPLRDGTQRQCLAFR